MKDLLDRERKIRDRLLYVEMDISLLESELHSAHQDLATLDALKKELEYNIFFLKQPNIIAVASEYAKSVRQLGRVKSKITEVQSLRNNLKNKIEKRNEDLEYYINEYEKIYDIIENERVILTFKPKEKK